MTNHVRIRPATERDLPELLEVYLSVYPDRDEAPDERAAYFRLILTQHPWPTDALPSLVCEDGQGRIVGFLGVLPRPMWLGGRAVRMAVSHHFMVDPSARQTLAAVRLLRAFFGGGQDLSMCEASDEVRTIWEALGGSTALLQSLYWNRPLRPTAYAVSRLHARGLPRGMCAVLSPGCGVLDRGLLRIGRAPFQLPKPRHRTEDADSATILECIEWFSRRMLLRPAYCQDSLDWLLSILSRKRSAGQLCTRVVRSKAGERLGYYIFYANKGGSSQVVQIAAAPGAMGDVLDELLLDAYESGAIAVTGRLDPRFAEEISARAASLKYCNNWLLIHTSNPELERAIYTGNAFLTALEGEWWIPFHARPIHHPQAVRIETVAQAG